MTCLKYGVGFGVVKTDVVGAKPRIGGGGSDVADGFRRSAEHGRRLASAATVQIRVYSGHAGVTSFTTSSALNAAAVAAASTSST